MNTNQLLELLREIFLHLSGKHLTQHATALSQQRTAYQANQAAHQSTFIKAVGEINSELEWFYKNDDIEVFKILDLYGGGFLKDPNYANNILQAIRSNAAQGFNNFNQFLSNLTNLKTQIQNALTILSPLTQLQVAQTPNEGIIEIIFKGKTSINNITDGKEQIEDWFIILDAYATLLDIRREDFEIIGISKNSPTTIRIRTMAKHAITILGVVSSILTIEESFSNNRIMIEQLKAREIAPVEVQTTFIKQAEQNLQSSVNKHINEIIEQKLKEHNIDSKTDGDKATTINKGIHNQYNFIVNGGDVKFYINTPEGQNKVQLLESKKQEVNRIKENLDTTKFIAASDTTRNQ